MDNANLFPRYRFVMGALDILCAGLTHIVCLAVAPVLVYIARDFGLDEATAGYATTLHILAQGIFILIGPLLINRIDHKKTQFIGVSVMVIGSVLSYFAPNFPMLLAARFITGTGHGISSACTNSLIAAWFPAKEKSMVVTINSLFVVAITTLTYTATVPLFHAMDDSWRIVLLMLGGMLLALDIVWLIFARDNHALNEYLKQRNALEGKKTNAFSGMKEAFSRRDVRLLCLFMGFATIGANGINTYLPQFLQNVRGFTDASASSIVGIASGVGAAATLTGGVLTTTLGKRKPIIIPSMIVMFLFLTMSLILPGQWTIPAVINMGGNAVESTITFNITWVISAIFIIYTITSNLRMPASQTIVTELKDSSPSLVASAAALSYGIGFMGTFLTSPMLSFSTWAFGEEHSMLIFLPLFVISFIAMMLLPETGPGRKQKAN